MTQRIGLNPHRKFYEDGRVAFWAHLRRIAPVNLLETQREDWLLGWDAANTDHKDSFERSYRA